MEMDLPKLVEILGVVIIVIGLILIGFGLVLPTPSTEITHVSEFNQDYAEENYDSLIRIPFTDNEPENISAEDVHVVYNGSEYSNETVKQFNESIGTDDEFTVNESSPSDFDRRFIIEFEDGTMQVYEGSMDGVSPSKLLLMGIIIFIGGLFFLTTMHSSRPDIPESKQTDETNEWDFKTE